MSLALYRTYRPGRFADVVGQDHVTEPLRRALANDRVHHAYLFSGPRGCGKTSSARILARSLNCEQGPTPEPCGVCRSCVDLAPNGPGSLDVIELDAATHGLVDDARDLREKAHFAPVSSRFKVYIVDEAHQLGPGAANALLRIIEEPPPHVTFVFATTAPDKILGTIRSRTHHYPFRLIPARTLTRHLGWVCEQEGVEIEPAALALVARAGAGSARDALSVLGQLIAGAGPEGVTYELANALLGVTDAALLDEVVDAVSVGDGATVLTAVDRALESGHDPRRLLTDLLERLRDLLVMRAVPEAAERGLVDVPGDQGERMAAQAQHFGASDLVRLAEVVDEGITAMKGTTPTRLQLELVMARLLLPGAEDTVRGVQARLDRIERRIGLGGVLPAPPPTQVSASAPASELTSELASGAASEPAFESMVEPAAAHERAGTPPEPTLVPAPVVAGTSAPDVPVPTAQPAVAGPDGRPPDPPAGQQAPLVEPAEPAVEPAGEPAVERAVERAVARSGPGVADVRQLWPEVLDAVKDRRRYPWTLLSGNAQVAALEGRVLTLAFSSAGARDSFRRSGSDEVLRQALIDVLKVDWAVEAVVDQGTGHRPGAGMTSPTPGPAAPATSPARSTGTTAPPATAAPAPSSRPERRPPAAPARAGRTGGQRAAPDIAASTRARSAPVDEVDDVSPDDPVQADLPHADLLARELGATVIQQYDDR